MEGWTTESVLKKHHLWRDLAGPDAGATAITLQWLGLRISRLELALRNWLCETSGDDEDERKVARELLGLSPTWPHDQPGFVSGEYFIGDDADEFPMKMPAADNVVEFPVKDDLAELDAAALERLRSDPSLWMQRVGRVKRPDADAPAGPRPLPTDWTPTMYLRFVKRAATTVHLNQPTVPRLILQQGYAHADGNRIWVDVPTVEEGT